MISPMDSRCAPGSESSEGSILLVDKPLDWTSFDVVHRIRAIIGDVKVGHAGTLDPKATGLLIVCTGRQTKRIGQLTGLEKEYVGALQLGIRTPSYDLETAVHQHSDYSTVSFESLVSAAGSLVGTQLQTPPMFSAVKHRGTPLYKYARRGKTIERRPKEITVSEFSILSFAPPLARFRVTCTKGTYIRTLVSDLGERLLCGATLTELRRTRIGDFRIEDALSIEQLDCARSSYIGQQTTAYGNRLQA